MSWYRDDDVKIITDEEFYDDCFECSAFCAEGTISVRCNGERTDCPYFKEVDTSEYDKKIRNKAIDEMKNNLIRNSRTEVIDGEICLIVTDKRIKQIAEQMKGGE